MPQQIEWQKGFFKGKAKLNVYGISEKEIALSKHLFKKVYDIDLLSQENISNQTHIFCKNDSTLLHPDEYQIKISKKKIEIKGRENGIFYAFQTLFQLYQESSGKKAFPCVEINDWPRFSYRGMHLDVSRHFFPPKFIKKYIDYLSMYKFNTFHWHLTDDQGWRIEIKSFPDVCKKGAWRKGSQIGTITDNTYDTLNYGGYYTQEEVSEIVAYANNRHIQIIPEIEMPGHSQAAVSSYPKLSCDFSNIDVAKGWGVSNHVLCCKEESFDFIRNVISEIAPLFPSPIIHIGGDECPKDAWKKCEHCQSIKQAEQLKNEDELQSYFIKRVEKIAQELGKNIIGWDEILEGGLAANAMVMSWRGMDGGIEAAKMKHRVVMTPGAYCYFDHYQSNPEGEPHAIGGFTSVQKVYQFEPVPKALDSIYQEYIIGAQANVWTEYIATPEHVEYMIFPRMLALAEVLWLDKEKKNEKDFLTRLQYHFNLLQKLNINYAKSIFDVNASVQFDSISRHQVILLNNKLLSDSIAISKYQIRYTIDGSAPTLQSNLFTQAFEANKSINVQAILCDDHSILSKIYTQNIYINQATGKAVQLLNAADPQYNCGGKMGLNDGIVVEKVRVNSKWMGWRGNDMDAIIDLEKDSSFNRISIGLLKQEVSWIHAAKEADLYFSSDKVNWTNIAHYDSAYMQAHPRELVYTAPQTLSGRYVRIVLKNQGKIPEGFPGAGEKAWLFCDEIKIEKE